jgi:ATP-dependent DNA ligase
VSGLYSSMGNVPALGLAPLPARDPRFVHGPAELCQLAGVWNGKPLAGDWRVEEKHDGIRMLWVDGQMLTREGEPMTCAEHLRPELERLQRRYGVPMMFDGEYAEAGGFLPTLAAFRRGTGGGRFHWFDAQSVDQWRAGGSKFPLINRRSIMETVIDDWSPAGIALTSTAPSWKTKTSPAWLNGYGTRGARG